MGNEKTKVIDADITEYFDPMPHDSLLREVARRTRDWHILRLIQIWLRASIVEEREDGKKGYRKNVTGVP